MGWNPGFNFHGKARVGLLFINAFGEIGYTTFSGNGAADTDLGTIDISHKLVSIKLGPEFAVNIPMSPITPYFQGFLSLNSISGSCGISRLFQMFQMEHMISQVQQELELVPVPV